MSPSSSATEFRNPRSRTRPARTILTALAAIAAILVQGSASAGQPPSLAGPPILPPAEPTSGDDSEQSDHCDHEGPSSCEQAPCLARPAPVASELAPAPVVIVSRTDANTLDDAVWTGLEGELVTLILRDGSELRGTVVAHSSHELGFAREGDGTVIGITRTEIVNVRLSPASKAARPTKTGKGLRAGGAFLLAFGGAASLSGTAILAVFPEFTFIHLPLLLPGLAMLGGGSAMLVAGNNRRRAYEREWGTHARRHRLSPVVAATRHAAHVGFVLQF